MIEDLKAEAHRANARMAHEKSVVLEDGVEVISGGVFDVAKKKRKIEELSFDYVETALIEGRKEAASLAKMVLEGKHYPKTKINLSGKLDGMGRGELVGHMKKLLDKGSE